MNALVKKIAAAATALALAAAVTLSAADAPAANTALDLASVGVDVSGAEYAVDMGTEFASEDNVQTAFIFWLISLIVTAVIVVGVPVATGVAMHT